MSARRAGVATPSALHTVALVGECCDSDTSAIGELTGELFVRFQTVGELLQRAGAHAQESEWSLILVDERVLRAVNGVVAMERLRKRFSVTPTIVLVDRENSTSGVGDERAMLRFVPRPQQTMGLAILIRAGLPTDESSEHSMEREIEPVSGSRPTRNPRQIAFDIALSQIDIHFQPVVRWSDRSLFGYEALLRCAEPNFRNPVVLFDEAEALHRLFDLSREARRTTATYLHDIPALSKLLVNIHVRDLLDDQLYDRLGPLMADPRRIIIEITERASLLEISDAQARIARLRDLGFQIALDDLGAGYSGLTLITLLEPEVVKIDMGLIRDIHLSKTKQTVVGSLLKLANDIGASTICEGVENAQERDALLALGCDLFQGYFFGRPAPGFSAPLLGA